ncbi:unnamed protein product [Bursaphelenchus xylophilus]|uniref:Cilia- and flagella-associated protein 36 n=1 Tax=Bursaphelenchus xylophilus TaxID=6326 RepID=A0A1I7RNA2_BURXY|nr:unnamed protein product [Bursaphelenchus xylophilus]CAG9123803.1 unnamed protein product [Bursaphelenchus xylophilus]
MKSLRRRSQSNPRKNKPVFKNFLEFLGTDVWRLPTLNFLEKNSILFNHDQAKHELCVQAHEKYTELVDALIESYCIDTNIELSELVTSLKSQDIHVKLTDKERKLLEPVLAAQDFNVFVHLMTRINIELQLQAVRMLEHICGVNPVSFKLSDEEAELFQNLLDEDETERYIIISVLKQSKEEFERDEKLRKALEEAFEASLAEVKELERQRVEEISQLDHAIAGTEADLKKMDIKSESSKKAEEKSPAATTNGIRRASAAPSLKLGAVKAPLKHPAMSLTEEKTPTGENKFDFKGLLHKKSTDDNDKLKQRTEYLKQQRDKLIEARQKQREKQLIEAAQRNSTDRPRTSQAARGALKGSFAKSENSMDMVEARKAIANRIREQVMGQKKE